MEYVKQCLGILMLKSNFFVAASMGLAASLQLLFMRFVAETGGLELLGKYTYLIGLITPLIVFFNFGIRNINSTRELYMFESSGIKGVKLFGWLCSFCCCLFLFFYADKVEHSLFILVMGYKLLESLYELAIANYLYKKNVSTYLLSSTLKFLSVAIVLFGSMYLELNLEQVVYLVLLAFLLGGIIDLYEFHKFSYEVKLDKEVLRKGAALGLGSIIAAMTVSFPRVYLGYEEDFLVLADLGVLLFFVSLLNLAWNSYLQLNLSNLTQIYVKKSGLKKTFLRSYVCPAVCIGLLVLLFTTSVGNAFIRTLFGNNISYFSSGELLLISFMSLASLLQASSNNLLVCVGEISLLTNVNILFLLLSVIGVIWLYDGSLISILTVLSIINFFNFLLNSIIGLKKNAT